jgi:hypothetical protein
MSSIAPRAFALLALASVPLVALSAAAAPCGRPDVDVTFPPHDATNVPPNAQLAAHYSSPALYDDEPAILTDAQGNSSELSTSFDEADAMLRASPAEPLSAGFYSVVWPALRSVSSGGVGRGSSVDFFVQDGSDTASPRFEGLTRLDWDLSRDNDPCLDRLDERFVFQLELGPASDDAGANLLAVLVFQTKDPLVAGDERPRRVLLSALPENGKLEVRRPASKAGKTCFAAVVQDLVGNVSGGGEVELCAKTKKPPFFDGCSVSAGRGAGPAAAPASVAAGAWVGLLLGLGLLRRGASAARLRRSTR